MKREIEFRGRRIDNNEWVTGSLVEEEAPLQCFGPKGKSEFVICKSGFADWNMPRPMTGTKVYPESVGQFTGLFDKNKKKVYTGDIVNVTNKGIYNGLKVVEWDDILFCYVLIWIDCYPNWKHSSSGTTYLKVSSGLKCEVTGNIFETQNNVNA